VTVVFRAPYKATFTLHYITWFVAIVLPSLGRLSLHYCDVVGILKSASQNVGSVLEFLNGLSLLQKNLPKLKMKDITLSFWMSRV